MKLNVVLVPKPQKGYTVYVPALLGCISEGKTKKEALKNIKEAIELYLTPQDELTEYSDAIVEKIAI
jgi:predicted RNase H-like HicB family nuclease